MSQTLRDVKFNLTHETLITLLAEAMAIVNNRPLVPVSTDPKDNVITPMQLLTMKSRPILPLAEKIEPEDVYATKWWKQSQHLADKFWAQWRREFLQSLQPRPKWQQSKYNLRTGDIVLLKEACPRNQWPRAIVEEAIPSQDGLVRKVKIRTASSRGILERPVTELVLISPQQLRN